MGIAQPKDGEPIRVVLTRKGIPRYRVRLDAGLGPDGQRRQIRSVHDTLSAARAHVAAHRVDLERGVLVTPDRQSFAEYATAWLATRARRVRPVTLTGYRTAIAHAVTAFGGKPLAKITRPDVERMVGQLADAGRSQRTAALTLFVLRSVLAQALDDGLVVRNVAARVQATGKPSKDRGALSAADYATLREYLSGVRLGAVWALTLLGLRRSEVLGLKWSDVDLTAGTITIERGVVGDASGKRSAETPTKTRRGERTLPLPSDELAALKALRECHAAEFGFEHVRTGWLAVDEIGQPYRPERWSDLWREHCQAARVEPVTLHAARHTSVTAMRAAGVPDHVVAQWHGHDEVVMRRTYSHASQDALAAAGRALSDVLGGAQ